MKTQGAQGQRGFSLVELLIATAIFGIMVIGVSTLYSTILSSFNRGENKTETQEVARFVLDLMSREMRLAGYDPSGAIAALPTTAIQVATANSVTFVADVDGNDVTDQVRYRLQGTQVVRDSAVWGGTAFPALAGASEVAGDVAALTFTYLDDTDTVTAVLADIRKIRVDIVVQRRTASGELVTFPLTMDVTRRNP